MLDRLTIERMRVLAGDGSILIALSGGGDSVALLHLLVDQFGPTPLRVAVVDHALREGSALDAQRALAFAKSRGVAGEVLTLSWRKEANRAQQAAREARYTALCDHGRAIGARVIVVGHNADDQAETVLMRAGAGSSWRGLAGMAAMAPAPLWPEGRGIMLARPLLGVRRTMLRAYLRERGAEWIEDPANTNIAFERVRVRQRLVALEAAGFEPMRLVRLAARLRARAERIDHEARVLIAAAAKIDRDVRIDRGVWRGPDQVRWRALSVLMAAAAGAARAPAFSIMKQLEEQVTAAGYQGGTHSGVRFSVSTGELRLSRDPGAVLGRADGAPTLAPLPLPVGHEVVWDGRFMLCAREPFWVAAPAENRDLIALRLGDARQNLDDAEHAVDWRALLAERVAHALGPVNGAQ